MAKTFTHRLRVRYVECDMQGIAFNAHYYTWIDDAYTELWRDAFGPLSSLRDEGCDFVVAESSARYRASARYDEVLDVAVEVESMTTTSMTTTHSFLHQDQLLVEGRIRHVCVGAETMAKAPWPDAVREAFASYVATNASSTPSA
jgi:acyl-CoA thioester hydrolase